MLASTIELQNENVLIFEIESVHLNNKIKKGRIFKSVSGVIRKTGYSIIMQYFERNYKCRQLAFLLQKITKNCKSKQYAYLWYACTYNCYAKNCPILKTLGVIRTKGVSYIQCNIYNIIPAGTIAGTCIFRIN